MNKILLTISIIFSFFSISQDYTSYFTGSATNADVTALGGICLMGGASESDEAMTWFLNQANGGDVLVLRASGSDGYNDYLYTDLGVTVNSVETIVFHNAAASNETYIQDKIKNAEAIWIAGGDQWNYISYWRDTKIDSLINDGIANRNMVIGGTSAGMAIQGKFYFSAEVGSATSAQALGNPYHQNVTVDSLSFIKNNYLTDVITDTHYDNPNRKGRHVTFMARIIEDYDVDAKGIACDEYTAVCIGTDGIAHVFGDHPTYDDNVYFIRTNCLLADKNPENCTDGNLLNWNRGGEALKVYAVKGTTTGNNTFNLNNWETGVGGEWQHWYVNNGTLVELAGTPPNCAWLSNDEKKLGITNVFPNPSQTGLFYINSEILIQEIWVIDINGKVLIQKENINQNTLEIDLGDFSDGIYFIQIIDENDVMNNQKLIKG